MLREAGFYSERWRDLGRRLGLNAIDVNDIERDYSRGGGVKRCLEEVIERWISEGENTWEVYWQTLSPNVKGKTLLRKFGKKLAWVSVVGARLCVCLCVCMLCPKRQYLCCT